MLTGGIDVGFLYTKAVIVEDNVPIGCAVGYSGGAKRADNVLQVWQAALSSSGIKAGSIYKVAVTGKGKYDVPFADKIVTEPVCLAKAASVLYPETTTVVDIGADSTKINTLLENGKIEQMLTNQKCSAGIGLMLELTAEKLGMSLEDFSGVKAEDAPVVVSDGCMVFAELDMLSLLNQGYSSQAVAAAVIRAAAVRASVVYDDITIKHDENVLLCGGTARNTAFVTQLVDLTGLQFRIPDAPEYLGAIGAAMLAAAD